MKTFQFKTNIKCGGCVATVTPFMNELKGISHWEVDTNSSEKTLTVEATGISKEEIIETVKKAGYKIE